MVALINNAKKQLLLAYLLVHTSCLVKTNSTTLRRWPGQHSVPEEIWKLKIFKFYFKDYITLCHSQCTLATFIRLKRKNNSYTASCIINVPKTLGANSFDLWLIKSWQRLSQQVRFSNNNKWTDYWSQRRARFKFNAKFLKSSTETNSFDYATSYWLRTDV